MGFQKASLQAARFRFELSLGIAAGCLLLLALLLPPLLPGLHTYFQDSAWEVLAARLVLFGLALSLVLVIGVRLWRRRNPAAIATVRSRSSAIKGPTPFTGSDGTLFWELGRQDELRQLRDFVLDDQVALIVLMGSSGSGKTSLLRAGLPHILQPAASVELAEETAELLREKLEHLRRERAISADAENKFSIDRRIAEVEQQLSSVDPGARRTQRRVTCHYWEATANRPEERLLRAINADWSGELTSLDALLDLPLRSGEGRHVVILDQLEQLGARDLSECPIFKLLRRVATETDPPHRVTWIVSFRREFRADWQDFINPLQMSGFFPRELSLQFFSPGESKRILQFLCAQAELVVEEAVAEDLVDRITVRGRVSPVDIGISLMTLAELQDRAQDGIVGLGDYHVAGGADGLLTQYVLRSLDRFPDDEQSSLVKAMLLLCDRQTQQRLGQGRTARELAQRTQVDPVRLQPQLERLTKRDVRVLEEVTGEDELRYRLAHERLVPVVLRISGNALAAVDQAADRLRAAFLAWRSNGRRWQYLLAGRQLRRIEKHWDEIPREDDHSEKYDFLQASRRWRWGRYAAVVLAVSLTAFLLSAFYTSIRTNEATAYLEIHGLPRGLYRWQHRLDSLTIHSNLDLTRLSWLESRRVQKLSLKGMGHAPGLKSLQQCSALRDLKLELWHTTAISRASDLESLNELTRLTDLELVVRNKTSVTGLPDPARFPQLRSLRLQLGDLVEAGQLPRGDQLKGLQNLRLWLQAEDMRLPDFRSLDELESFSLELVSSRSDAPPVTLEFLQGMTRLKSLELDLDRALVGSLPRLSAMQDLESLQVEIDATQVGRIAELGRAANLTRLRLETVDWDGSEARVALPDFEPFGAIKTLGLSYRYCTADDLAGLETLADLENLELRFRVRSPPKLDPLARLKHLRKLCLEVENCEQLDFIEGLENLEYLRLTLTGDAPPSLTPLGSLHRLKSLHLDLSFSNVDLGIVKQCRGLESLSILLPYGPPADLSWLEDVDAGNLRHLSVEMGAPIAGRRAEVDLSPLGEFKKLTSLSCELTGVEVRGCDRLAALPELGRLRLWMLDCNGIDLEFLSHTERLRELVIQARKCGVRQLFPDARLTALEKLTLNMTDEQTRNLERLPARVRELTFGLPAVGSPSPGPFDNDWSSR